MRHLVKNTIILEHKFVFELRQVKIRGMSKISSKIPAFLMALLFVGCKTLPNSRVSGDPETFADESFGVEVEFRGGPVPSASDHPYLDPVVDAETSGNTEVKTIGGETDLDEVNMQMANLEIELGDRLKSFHFRMRIKKDRLPQEMKADPRILRGAISRLGDIVDVWRLQWRNPIYSLREETQRRSSPEDLSTTRGTIRLIDLGDSWDIEIRGYMNQRKKIIAMVRLIRAALKDPASVTGYWDVQQGLHTRIHSLASLYREAQKKTGHSLNPATVARLDEVESTLIYDNLLPLYNYAEQPALTKKQRDRIVEADAEFRLGLVSQASAIAAADVAGAQGICMALVKAWAEKAQLSKAMTWFYNNKAFDDGLRQRAVAFRDAQIAKAKASGSERLRAEAAVIEAKIRGDESTLSSWSADRVRETLSSGKSPSNILLLWKGSGSEWRGLTEKALVHPSVEIQTRAWRVVRERPESEISTADLVAIYKKVLATAPPGKKARKGAMNGFFNGTKKPPVELVEGCVRDTELTKRLRTKALSVVILMEDERSVQLVEYAFGKGGLRDDILPYVERAKRLKKRIPQRVLELVGGAVPRDVVTPKPVTTRPTEQQPSQTRPSGQQTPKPPTIAQTVPRPMQPPLAPRQAGEANSDSRTETPSVQRPLQRDPDEAPPQDDDRVADPPKRGGVVRGVLRACRVLLGKAVKAVFRRRGG